MIKRNSPAEVRHADYLLNNLKRILVLIDNLQSYNRLQLHSNPEYNIYLQLIRDDLLHTIDNINRTLDEDNQIISHAINLVKNTELVAVNNKIEIDISLIWALKDVLDTYI
jgi:hypothetical protein